MRSLITLFLFVFCSLHAARAQFHEIARLKLLLETEISQQERADTYAHLGMRYTDRNLDSGYYYASKALELAQSLNDKRSEARALNVLAHCYMETGKPYLAYKLTNEALSIFTDLGLKEDICVVTMNQGVLLLKEGKHDQGLAYMESAYQQSLTLEKDSVGALILINLAFPRSLTKPYHEIEKLYEEAASIASRYNDERALMILKLSRNGLKFVKGVDLENIKNNQLQIVNEFIEKGYESLAILGYRELGNMFMKENLDSAVYYLEKGIQLSEVTGYEVLNYHLIAQTYDILRGHRPDSPKVSEYSNRLFEIGKDRAMEAHKDGFSFMEMAVKEKDFEIQQAQLRIRQMWVVGLTIVGLLALLFGLLVYRQLRIKRKMAKDLEIGNMQLSIQNTQLEDNNEFHKKLISMLSHDLRQPFSTIIMMSHEIFDQLDERQKRVVFDEIRQSAKTSLQTMDGMLYWMKLQMLGLADNPTSVSVRDNMEQAMEFNGSLIRMRNIEIRQDIDESFAVLVQPEMMLFVNRNLLHNAVKHTSQGGQIRVSAVLEPTGHVLVRVSDTGSGISPEVLSNLFRKGVQEHVSKPGGLKDRQKGAGLALIVCHEMIEKMGGTMWAENNQKSVGASFLYRLPMANPLDMDEAQYGKSNRVG